jgi:serine/threonine-protein kinase 24/25/MST4
MYVSCNLLPVPSLTPARRDLSSRGEEDEWVFDTVRPRTANAAKETAQQTARRRKVARIPSTDAATNMMQRMDLDAAPLGDVTDSPLRERRPRSSQQPVTALRVPSGATPTARRLSNVPKQPLGVDLTFGNSPSTVRHFKRVPSGERRAALRSNPSSDSNNGNLQSFQPNPHARTFRPSPTTPHHPLDVNNENTPPTPDYPPMPVTKDALYGRRAYSKVLDSVFQEAYSDTASPHQREAIGRVGQAWQQLDEVDPHGEFLLLKAMVDRLKKDTKLAAALGLELSPAQSPRKHNTNTSDTSLSGTTVHGTSTTRIHSSRATRSTTTVDRVCSEERITSSEESSTTSTSSFLSPSSTPVRTSSGSPIKNTKLQLAQNTPQLKSNRRRQSAAVTDKSPGQHASSALDEKKLPGYVEKGMEQQGLLADILYGQWTQGVRNRWPVA